MTEINGVVFDYGFTLSSDLYFNVAPPGVDNWQTVLNEAIFDAPDVVRPWMTGEIGLEEIAQIVAEHLSLAPDSILVTLKQGCVRLKENPAVKNLALELKLRRIPIALVTVNFDIFNDVVVPAHGYDALFDVIVNSSDYGSTDKRHLWPIAFAGMGEGIGYGNALLIEDGEREPRMYREMDGNAIEYVGDRQLREQIASYEFVSVSPP